MQTHELMMPNITSFDFITLLIYLAKGTFYSFLCQCKISISDTLLHLTKSLTQLTAEY